MDPNPPAPFCNYFPARRLVRQCLPALRPAERVTTADYAAAHRYLANEGGGYVGRWTHTKAPYLVAIMDALDSPDYTTIAVVGPGQCGKTAIAENWLLKQVCTDPADLLWYMHTETGVEAYVKQTINPMVETHDGLAGRIGRKPIDNSLSFKRFAGMSVQFLSATRSTVVNKRAGRIIADEFDAWNLDGADPKTLLDVRRQTYGKESKLFALSHPDRAAGLAERHWKSGIMALYADSDRRTWWWPCPQCALWSSPNPGARFHMALTYDDRAPLDDIAEHAHLLCPHNSCIVTDSDRRAMNAEGKWIGRGQSIDEETGDVTGELAASDTAGFWIVGTMSSLLLAGIGGLARARVKAEREAESTGEYESLKQVVVKQLGHPYDPPAQLGTLDATVLADRADPALRLGIVPAGVRFITCAIDVQGNRFELLYRGWGLDRESWIIDHQAVRTLRDAPIDPATDPKCWDDVLAAAMDAEFPLADASGRVMKVRAVGIDSAGAPGVTENAYNAWRRQRKTRHARFMGMVSGRETYNLLLLKGSGTPNARNLSVVKPDMDRKDRRAAARGEVPLGIFNSNSFKDALAGQLARAEPGAGYVHIPAALRPEQEPPYAFFEQLVAEQRAHNGTWSKINVAARNEGLDLMVMSAVIAHLHAPSRFDWQRPPPWAREWDQNPLVGPPTVIQAPLPPALAGAPAPNPAAVVPPRQPAGPGIPPLDPLKSPAPWAVRSAPPANPARPW